MNCAFNNKYNPAREAKFNTRNNAERTGLGRVIINTADTAQIDANTIKRMVSKVITPLSMVDV